jgi:putative endopeptidase
MRMIALATGVFAVTALSQGQKILKSGIDVTSMDTSCKPCDDFWRYANGTWLDKNPIPARRPSWGVVGLLREANQERVKVILEAAQASRAPADSKERKIGNLYSSCLDTTAIDAAGLDPVRDDLKRIAAITNTSDVAAVILSYQRGPALTPTFNGNVGPFVISVARDLKNTTETILFLSPAPLSLPDRDHYLKTDERATKIREEFRGHVRKILAHAGDSDEDAAVTAETVLRMETAFANATLTNVQRRNPDLQYHKMDWADVQKLVPAIDWKSMRETVGIPGAQPVNVTQPDFFKELQKQLVSTPLGDWKRWLKWRALQAFAPVLSRPFEDEYFRFNSGILRGVTEQLPRWERCAAIVDLSMGDALGELFVQKHFTAAAKRRMMDMVENLQAALRDEIGAATWLATETRKNAIAKLDTFYPKIGHPERWKDYADVQLTSTSFVSNLRVAARARRVYLMAKIGKPGDRNDWVMTPPTVNAYYSSQQNEIVFPAGILQPPMFDLEADDAVNYGAIGSVIGHELGHGFDDQGSKFDAKGNLNEWWTAADRKQFETRAQCVTDQFNTLDVGNGLRHNGSLVVGEALGDLGGLRLAYLAYKRSLKGKDGPVIDGFTADQRFFLAFARNYATNVRSEALRLQLTTDPHPLPKFRAIGTLQNMPEFHKAFNCKSGDAMVRPAEKQCRLW